MYLSIGQAANMMGVSISTLRRWDEQKEFEPTVRTVGGHRRYSIKDIKKYLGEFVELAKRKVIAYARVSSHDQKSDLHRQIDRLDKYCQTLKTDYEVIDDLGSGLNYKKRGLKKLLKLICTGQVSKIILTHKDRLLRFGVEIIFWLCHFYGTDIEIIEGKKQRTDEEDLAYDVLEIITVFSARLYGRRAHQNRRLKAS